MPSFTAADVKRLRELTGAGMLDCKNALTEADGDIEAATEILRVKYAAKVDKKAAERTAGAAQAETPAFDPTPDIPNPPNG